MRVLRDEKNMTRMDLGIVKYHFEVGAGGRWNHLGKVKLEMESSLKQNGNCT